MSETKKDDYTIGIENQVLQVAMQNPEKYYKHQRSSII